MPGACDIHEFANTPFLRISSFPTLQTIPIPFIIRKYQRAGLKAWLHWYNRWGLRDLAVDAFRGQIIAFSHVPITAIQERYGLIV